MFQILLIIVIAIFLALVGSFIPIGNENSTVRRLPWVTFTIMAANVIIFYVTLPVLGGQMEEVVKEGTKLQKFISENRELMADEAVRKKLVDAGVMDKEEAEEEAESIEVQRKLDPEYASDYDNWLKSSDANELRQQLDQKLAAFKNVREQFLWYKYGLAPNGEWKFYQLITSAFLHGGNLHLWGNMLFFFAVAFSLEDLWGRGVFLGFYLLGAMAACIPSLVEPAAVPSIGASGAISATMGAFLFRLPKTKIKLLCIQYWWLRILLARKSAIFMVPGYIYLASYFIAQVLYWYFDKKTGSVSGVGYSIHVAGFIFGALFALMMKATKTEETYINPKIEAKVSFSAAPAVNQALDFLDRGETAMAERKLRAHLAKNAADTNALMALIQVYQATNNFDQLNSMYARLIRVHLSKNDKEAALYAYDNLLSAFPDNNIAVKIPARDWLTICEYLREAEMNREAAVEYERLVDAHPHDPLAGRAAIQGGEAAMMASDTKRALKLFEAALATSLAGPLIGRAEAGAEKCRRIIAASPKWTQREPIRRPQAKPVEKDLKKEEVPV